MSRPQRQRRSPEADTRGLRLRQVPLAVVMVALTTLTLWSLGQAIVKSPTAAGAGPVPVVAVADRRR